VLVAHATSVAPLRRGANWGISRTLGTFKRD
jgi:hypothetical protein